MSVQRKRNKVTKGKAMREIKVKVHEDEPAIGRNEARKPSKRECEHLLAELPDVWTLHHCMDFIRAIPKRILKQDIIHSCDEGIPRQDIELYGPHECFPMAGERAGYLGDIICELVRCEATELSAIRGLLICLHAGRENAAK